MSSNTNKPYNPHGNTSKEAGAMWVKTSKNGEKFVSISLEINGVKHRLVAFKNRYKDASNEADANKPDYRILLSEEQAKPVTSPARKVYTGNDEDVPF